MAQGREDIAVGSKRAAKAPDSLAGLDQQLDLQVRIAARGGQCVDIEVFELCFDFIERAEIAAHDPFEEIREKGWRVESSELPLAGGGRSELVDHRDLGAVGGQQPVSPDEAVENHTLAIDIALIVRDGDRGNGEIPALPDKAGLTLGG